MTFQDCQTPLGCFGTQSDLGPQPKMQRERYSCPLKAQPQDGSIANSGELSLMSYFPDALSFISPLDKSCQAKPCPVCWRAVWNLLGQEMWQSYLPEDIQLHLPYKERTEIPAQLESLFITTVIFGLDVSLFCWWQSCIYTAVDVAHSVTDHCMKNFSELNVISDLVQDFDPENYLRRHPVK